MVNPLNALSGLGDDASGPNTHCHATELNTYCACFEVGSGFGKRGWAPLPEGKQKQANHAGAACEHWLKTAHLDPRPSFLVKPNPNATCEEQTKVLEKNTEAWNKAIAAEDASKEASGQESGSRAWSTLAETAVSQHCEDCISVVKIWQKNSAIVPNNGFVEMFAGKNEDWAYDREKRKWVQEDHAEHYCKGLTRFYPFDWAKLKDDEKNDFEKQLGEWKMRNEERCLGLVEKFKEYADKGGGDRVNLKVFLSTYFSPADRASTSKYLGRSRKSVEEYAAAEGKGGVALLEVGAGVRAPEYNRGCALLRRKLTEAKAFEKNSGSGSHYARELLALYDEHSCARTKIMYGTFGQGSGLGQTEIHQPRSLEQEPMLAMALCSTGFGSTQTSGVAEQKGAEAAQDSQQEGAACSMPELNLLTVTTSEY
jgi:hypothetical protein